MVNLRNPGGRRRQEGQALILALVVVLLGALTLTLIGSSLFLRMRLAQEEARRVQLQALLDGAVAQSLAELASDPSFRGLEPMELGTGVISSEIEELPSLVRITARAQLGVRSRAIEVEALSMGAGPIVSQWRLVPVKSGD